jgi:uncharacterized protein
MKFDWEDGNRAKMLGARADRGNRGRSERQSHARVIGDPYEGETRFRATGRNGEGRGVFVVFTPRYIDGEIHLRPISARYIHREKS